MRAKHIKMSPHAKSSEEKCAKKDESASSPSSSKNEECERILDQLRDRFDVEDVMLLEELFRLSGILYDPGSPEDLDSAFEDVTSQTILQLQHMVEEYQSTVDELEHENRTLKDRLEAGERSDIQQREAGRHSSGILNRVSGTLGSLLPWF